MLSERSWNRPYCPNTLVKVQRIPKTEHNKRWFKPPIFYPRQQETLPPKSRWYFVVPCMRWADISVAAPRGARGMSDFCMQSTTPAQRRRSGLAKWNDAKRTQEESRRCKEACREHKDAKALRCCLVCSIREAEGPNPSTEHSLIDRPQATTQCEQSR